MRINRGKLNLDGVAEKALEYNAQKVMIVSKWRGDLGKIQFFRIGEKGLDVISPLIHVKDVKLRRDYKENVPRGRRIKSVAITASQKAFIEVNRLKNALSKFLNIPILSLEEIHNRKGDAVMQISVDFSNRIVVTFKLIPELVEVGPRFRISNLVWELT